MLNLSRWLALTFAVVMLGLAGLAQRFLDGSTPGPGFVILLPAVTIIAFFAGSRLAGIAAVIGIVLTLHEPLQVSAWAPLRADDILRAALFAIAAGVDILMIHSLNASLLEARAHYEATLSTLERQQTLFQELQHRVANNIQFVGSLLTLHRNRLSRDASSATDALDAARDRLGNVARIHRRLADPHVFATQRLYLEELCGDLVAGFPVTVVCHVDSALPPLSPNKLVTLSLVVTEAVTNALKHAFPGAAVGKVAVDLARAGPGTAILTVRDNGKGLPPDFESRRGASLGMRILEGLAHQLDGTLRMEGGEGTTVRIDFKL